MSNVTGQSVGQGRWNHFGVERVREIETNPQAFVVSQCPIIHLEPSTEILELLSPLDGRRVLELGFGRGEFSVWMAKQGASVSAVDIGPDLVAAAKALASANGVECDFRQSNVIELPYDFAAYDVVIGCAILHHLSENDVLKALQEVRRVLKPNGRAIFYECVENSRLFDFMQNLLPAGQKGGYYRPSILNRRAWAEYTASLDDRDMTTREFLAAGKQLFRYTRVSPHGLLIRLERLFNHRQALKACDRVILKVLPPLRRYCQTVVAEYRP